MKRLRTWLSDLGVWESSATSIRIGGEDRTTIRPSIGRSVMVGRMDKGNSVIHQREPRDEYKADEFRRRPPAKSRVASSLNEREDSPNGC